MSSYHWLGSWVFLPLGYVLIGPVAEAIGYKTTLLLAVGWTVFSSLAILAIPSVRNLRSATGVLPVDEDALVDTGGDGAFPRGPSGEREGVPAG